MRDLQESMERVRTARANRHYAAKGIAGGPPLVAVQKYHAMIQSDARRECRSIVARLREALGASVKP